LLCIELTLFFFQEALLLSQLLLLFEQPLSDQ
jgi:hypothetical protein